MREIRSPLVLLATTVTALVTACKSAPPPPSEPAPGTTTTTVAAAPAKPARPAPVADTTLPARAVFSGNPDYGNVQISPDGKHLAYLAAVDGVLNLWLAPTAAPATGKPLTRAKDRPIRQYYWAEDDTHLLYLQDSAGDENFHVFAVDVKKGGEPVDLTPFPKTRAMFYSPSVQKPHEIVVGLNDRDPQHHDLYRIDLRTQKRTLLFQNDAGYADFEVDRALELRLATRQRPDGGADHLVKTPQGFVPRITVTGDDTLTTSPLGFDAAGKLYFLDSRDRDTAALTRVDLTTGKPTVLLEDARADAQSVLTHPVTGAPQAVSFNYERPEWKVLDKSLQADLDHLRKALHGNILITNRTRDDGRWLVVDVVDAGSPISYLYTRKTKTLTLLYTHRKALADVPLSRMWPRVIPSRDGLSLVSYLTVPRAHDADADGKPDAPLPLVLLVHGGPWGRDQWGFNAVHQWLASRGYAVLSVNYRGSTGFGKSFLNAANGEWAAKMHDDLLDAVKWSVDQGVADPTKVAIMGGSYGGYATLVGLTFTPETFACGVDIVGPSNIVTLLSTIPPYWAPMIDMMVRRIGADHRTPEGQKVLASRSPLTFADRIVRPLLIGQGANDPRVKQAESDQIVSAMAAKSIPVTYVLFSDEGHGFARPENRLAFDAVTEIFLAQCLGGRYQPVGGDFAGSTIAVPAGAAEIATLPEALPR